MLAILEKIFGLAEGALAPSGIYIYLALAAVIAALGYGVYHYHGSLEAEKTAYEVLLSKNTELVDMIKANAQAVDQYAADEAAAAAKAKAALAAAQKQAKSYQALAQGILLAKPSDPNMCTSADNLFNLFLTEDK